MENIAVGVPDPGRPAQALDWAVHRSRRGPCRILLVRAVDLLVSDAVDEQDRLDELRHRIMERSPSAVVETRIVTSSVPSALLSASADADLLVIGSHRRHPLLAALSGWLPLRVATGSRGATVLVPDDWTPPIERTIVVGIAEDDSSDRAALFAAREARATGELLEVVHAWIPATHPPTNGGRAHHRERLALAVDGIRAAFPNVRLRGILDARAAAPALLGRAAQAELLVLGSHRRGPLSGLVLGSCAQQVVPDSSTPVCIVPPVGPAPRDDDALEERLAATP